MKDSRIYLISKRSPDTISLPPLLLSRMNFPRSLTARLGKDHKGVLGRKPSRAFQSFRIWLSVAFRKSRSPFCFACFPYWFIYTARSPAALSTSFCHSGFPAISAGRHAAASPRMATAQHIPFPPWSPLWRMLTNTHISYPNWSKWIKHSSA